MQLLRRLGRDRRGSAAVQFALSMPILTALSLGSLELAGVIHDYHLLGEAARRAARAAVINDPIPPLASIGTTPVVCRGAGTGVSCGGQVAENPAAFTAVLTAAQEIFPRLTPEQVVVSYWESDVLSEAEAPGVVTPAVSVKLLGVQRDVVALGSSASVTLPSAGATLVGESYATF